MDDHTVTGRVFDVLEAVGSRASAGLIEIVAITGIPKSSAHRIAEDLVSRGALARVDDRYEIGARLHELVDAAPTRARFIEVEETLTELHARLGGIAWFAEHADRLTNQPTLLVSTPELRRIAAAGWPDPADRTMLAATAHGNAVLSARPDLVDRLVSGGTGERALYERLSRGVDLGAFFDDSLATDGWRCVAVRTGSGIVGVTVHGERLQARDMIRTTRDLAAGLSRTAR